ncbi:MAG: molybdopterin-dependent oxidoreductase [Myxococcota bacterium]
MGDFDRRDFLKLVGTSAGAAAAAGCAELPEKLIPYVVQPEEITPGLPVIYASTCQECAGGCGFHVKTREGRPIKYNGNPEHPINRGYLCSKGQASIGRTYHPDRYRGPMQRGADGTYTPVAWEEALAKLSRSVAGAGSKVAVFGAPVGPTLGDLIDQWLVVAGGGTRITYDPFAPEALIHATEAVFGVASQPIFDLSETDLVIDFGSDGLSTGLSPVEHTYQLMAARDVESEAGRKARLVYVGPRLDETAGASDEWLPAKPGTEGLLALSIASEAVASIRRRGGSLDAAAEALVGRLSGFEAAKIAKISEVPEATIRRLGVALANAKRPAALPPGVALTSRRATATNAAVLILNTVIGALGKTLTIPPVTGTPTPFREVARLIDAMRSGDVDVLVVHGSNPLHSLPKDAGFAEALEKVKLVVSTASMPDETSMRAHLVLPDHTTAESWGDAAPRDGVISLVQPTLRPLYDTRAFGDVLLESGRQIGGESGGTLPKGSFREVIEAAWSHTDWRAALQRGGVFRPPASAELDPGAGLASLEWREPQLEGEGTFTVLPVPSPMLGDGSGANLPLLQEIPDPITKVAWQSWAEISLDMADQLGVGVGDILWVETTYGRIEVPAWPRGGVRDDVIAIAFGQGHTVGRWASMAPEGELTGPARGVNVNEILPALTDESGGRAFLAVKAKVTNSGDYRRLPFTQATDNKRGRMLGESISLVALAKGGESPWAANEVAGQPHGGGHGDDHGAAKDDHGAAAAAHGDAGHGEGHGDGHGGSHEILRAFDPVDDSAPEDPYRWGMAVDLDRCTGCNACVVSCHIENNIPVVGEEGVLRSRQMSWMRIERFIGEGEQSFKTGRPGPQNHEELGNVDVRNSPMMCQQCGAAPCEPVCPVYATYHTESGLNGMIYNRCIGTRYCANNCPYKVRRFNWFDYQIEGWPEPMGLGLNPDVTVRGQGVMEKCTFCIQTIQATRQAAADEGRDVLGPGEVQTACQSSCASGAITFDNLKLPGNTATAKVDANKSRAYHALHVLNVRPAITYLAKVAREEGHEG